LICRATERIPLCLKLGQDVSSPRNNVSTLQPVIKAVLRDSTHFHYFVT
jgi:hypothetical protein